jgi:beta-glucosidase
MIMMTPECYRAALRAVETGRLDVSYVDRAVARILEKKFEMGLFEDQREPDLEKVKAGTWEHREKALRAAEETLVLLKNNNSFLPISPTSEMGIAVIGPNAREPIAQNGDWSLGSGQDFTGEQPPWLTVDVAAGVKERFPNATVLSHPRPPIKDWEKYDVNRAIEASKAANLIIVVVGDQPKYCGEYKSTATLRLVGNQEALLEAVLGLHIPFVLDIMSSKPLVIPERFIQAASAVIQQFSPGMLGGLAFAKVLAGEVNPSGKLSISMPCHVGQTPVYYNQVGGQHGPKYVDLPDEPKWAFGYGLSYSTYRYAEAFLDNDIYGKEDMIRVSVRVRNEGPYDGIEIVQFYVADLIASVTWPEQELKAYERVTLKANEERRVVVEIRAGDCSIVNAYGERVVEPGEFELRVGNASNSILFRLPFTIA